ncbi:MAG: hypothetical protein AUK48_12030 [Oscillatoriales cyanobacterium CG2_30_44_21]|nr:MAG: hypothetical protein AUK48_12030 [Oscillatoriales cyanobacterium CG2_30_44_21]
MNDVVNPLTNVTSPEAYLQFGDRYFAAGNIQLAIANYKRALSDPDFTPAHERIGAVYLDQGNWMEAIASFSKAIAINPEYLEAQLGLGNAYQQMGWDELAIAHFQTALKLAPERFLPEYHCQLGDRLKGRGQTSAALDCYERAIATHPEYIEGYRAIAKLYISQNNPEAIAALYERAESYSSELLRAKDYNLLGVAWIQKINSDGVIAEILDRAIAALQRAIQIEPDFADAHCNLGSALVQKGQTKDAIIAYKEAIDIDPSFAQPYFNLGILLNNIDKIDEAIACFESAIALVPDWVEAHQYLGNTLKRKT